MKVIRPSFGIDADMELRREYKEVFGVDSFDKSSKIYSDEETVVRLAQHYVFWGIKHAEAQETVKSGLGSGVENFAASKDGVDAMARLHIASAGMVLVQQRMDKWPELKEAVSAKVSKLSYRESCKTFVEL